MLQRLSSREKSLLALASLFVSVAGQWSLFDHADEQRNLAIEQLQKADAVQAMLLRLPAETAVRAVPDLPLARRITQTAADDDIELSRLDPQGTAVAVSIDQVRFDQLLKWIETAGTDQFIQVLSAEIGRRPEPGIVSARLLLGDRS